MTNKFKKIVISAMVLIKLLGGGFSAFSSEFSQIKNEKRQFKNEKRQLLINPILSEDEYEELIYSFKEKFKWSSIEDVRDYIERYFVKKNKNFTIDKKYKLYVIKSDKCPVSYAITTDKSWDIVDRVFDIRIEYLWANNENEYDRVPMLLYIIGHSAEENCRLSVGSPKESEKFYNKFMEFDRRIGKMPVFVNTSTDSTEVLKKNSEIYKQIMDNIFVDGERRLLIDPILSKDEYEELIFSYNEKFEKKSINEAHDDIDRFFIEKNENFIINEKYKLYVLRDGNDHVSYAITTKKNCDYNNHSDSVTIEWLWSKYKLKGYGASILLYLINRSSIEKFTLKLESRIDSEGFYKKFMLLDRHIGKMPVFVNTTDISNKVMRNLPNKYKELLGSTVVKNLVT